MVLATVSHVASHYDYKPDEHAGYLAIYLHLKYDEGEAIAAPTLEQLAAYIAGITESEITALGEALPPVQGSVYHEILFPPAEGDSNEGESETG